jgi:hypothetical protein
VTLVQLEAAQVLDLQRHDLDSTAIGVLIGRQSVAFTTTPGSPGVEA